MLTAINSALNPIIYMFRSNEFRIAFKKLFRGTSIVPLRAEGKTKARAARSRLEVSTCNQHRRQPSFPTVPTGDVRALSCRLPASSQFASAVEVTEANLPWLDVSPALISSVCLGGVQRTCWRCSFNTQHLVSTRNSWSTQGRSVRFLRCTHSAEIGSAEGALN